MRGVEVEMMINIDTIEIEKEVIEMVILNIHTLAAKLTLKNILMILRRIVEIALRNSNHKNPLKLHLS